MKLLLPLAFAFFCFQAFAQNEAAYDSLKQYVANDTFENELRAKMCQQFGNESIPTPFTEPSGYSIEFRVCDDSEDILTARICTGASTILVQDLREKFPTLKFSHVWTYDVWPSGFLHVFIKVKNFFNDGADLFIDPTYTQFIATNENYPAIKKDLRKIFMGRYEELEALHIQYGRNYPEYYLNTRPWGNGKSKLSNGIVSPSILRH